MLASARLHLVRAIVKATKLIQQLGMIGLMLMAGNTKAQIVPDPTLPQRSIVDFNKITGGTVAGTTLFHSFESFSIPTGITATFLPNANIQSIIARVTGKERSGINGILAVNGNANLFLLNPNGIDFGQMAQLRLNGSFIASTADSIKFADGTEFNAKTPQVPPILTISTPIGLQLSDRPGTITNQAVLAVRDRQTLGLVGGDILFNNGSVISPGGNLFLVSANDVGIVPLNGLNLEDTILPLGKVELLGNAAVIASGQGGGAIQVRGDQVILRDRSTILSDTTGAIEGQDIEIRANQFRLFDQALVRSLTFGTGRGGNVRVRANDIELVGAGFAAFERNYLSDGFNRSVSANNLVSAILTGTFGDGQSGNLTVEAEQLKLSQGAVIGSPTRGAGAGGNLFIRVGGNIDVTSAGIGTTANVSGKSGNIWIQANNLSLSGTGIVTTNTFGDGDSGNILINAANSVMINERYPGAFLSANISTATIAGQGNAGNLEINARRIQLSNGGTISTASGTAVLGRVFVSAGAGGNLTLNAADEIRVEGTGLAPGVASVISTNTFGSARAGNMTLNTRRLVSLGQSLIVGSTFGTGEGGEIVVNAAESILVEGDSSDAFGIGTNSGKLSFQRTFKLPPSTGAAGDVKIFTPQLLVQDEGRINVGSIGNGNAGTIQIEADRINLNNGTINATTNGGGKGNINLRSQLILLRNGSQITTNAGRSDGGNIEINTGILTAVPQENSNITANAEIGRGGNIRILAAGIFGLQQNPITAQSAITASSGVGLNGAVKLTTFGTEPKLTTEMPIAEIEHSDQIAQTCAVSAQAGEFVITGRGGLEPSVSERVQSTPIWIDVRGSAIAAPIPQSQIREANRWVNQADGSIALVADVPYHQTLSCGSAK